MNNSSLDRLLELAGNPIGCSVQGGSDSLASLARWGAVGRELANVLVRRNGLWAYESSLLLRPLENMESPHGLMRWNEQRLWKAEYAVELEHLLCFAEDVFGCQYCLANYRVCVFDPETCEIDDFCGSLDEWAEKILNDVGYCTGYPLAHDWQIKNGPLQAGWRLLPKKPFVLGGEFAVENLYAINEVDGMRFRASIANQIRDVPDGESVVLEVENDLGVDRRRAKIEE